MFTKILQIDWLNFSVSYYHTYTTGIYNLNVHFIHFNNKGSKMYGVNHFRPCFLRFRPAFDHCLWLSLSVYCNSGITMVLIGYKNCSQGFFENSLNLPLQSSLFSASGLKARPFNFTPAGCQEHFGSFGVHSRPPSARIFMKVKNVRLKLGRFQKRFCHLKIPTLP